MSDRKFPYTIHALAPEGLSIVTRAVSPFTADSITLYAGDSLEITEAIFALNIDRNGVNFLDLSTEEQQAKWRGRARFGVGPVPEHVKAVAEAAHRARLAEERANLLFTNPHIAKASAATRRLAALDAELSKK